MPNAHRSHPVVVSAACALGVALLSSCSLLLSWGDYDRDTDGAAGSAGSAASAGGPSVIVGLGARHACAARASAHAQAQCWGSNDGGQLGSGGGRGTGATATPITVPGVSGVRDFALGGAFSCASTGNEVSCWGDNSFGQLGRATDGNSGGPESVAFVAGEGATVTSIASGNGHTCAIVTGMGLQCWGTNDFGQLGTAKPVPIRADASTGADIESGSFVLKPQSIDDNNTGQHAAQVATGFAHTCVLLDDSMTVRCWGQDNLGQLGRGTIQPPGFTTKPDDVALTGTSLVKRVAAGGSFTCALTVAGDAYCWGENNCGQLGNGTFGNGLNGTDAKHCNDVHISTPDDANSSPVQITGLKSPVMLALGYRNACALVEGGEVWCWGDNTHGEMGNGESGVGLAQPLPGYVRDARGGKLMGASAVYVNGYFACALVGQSLVCWGQNSSDQLGYNTDGADAPRAN